MKKILLATILSFAFCFSAGGQVVFTAETVKVLDGDTCDILHSDGMTDRIRMSGLDAPEVAHNSKEISQPFGEVCKTALKTLIEGKTVTIEALRNRDVYGRIVGRILLNGTDVNLGLVKNGCAWLYAFSNFPASLLPDYTAAFENARTNKIGLFAAAKPIQPGVWRKKKHLKRKKKEK